MAIKAMSPNTILPFRTSTYAITIYKNGTNRLTARDGFAGVAAGYYTPVEQYAKNNFSQTDLDYALAKTWITEQEYEETMAL